MPQLDIVSYVAHYIWTLIFLFIYFSLLVNTILPKLQQQIAVRNKLSSIQAPGAIFDRHPGSRVEIFKNLWAQTNPPTEGRGGQRPIGVLKPIKC